MTLLEQLESVSWEWAAACGVGAYLLGCFSTGYYFYRARTGRDFRDFECGATGARTCATIIDRAGAIAHAIAAAAAADVVLIAGKGHEDYQIIGEEKRPFSDLAQAQAALARRHGKAASKCPH